MPPDLDLADARRVIAAALAEDVGGDDIERGDITSAHVIPAGLRFTGVMQARHDMVVAGLPVAAEAFRAVVPDCRFSPRVEDGAEVGPGTVLAEIEGPARGMLTAERTALNLLQLMSGIATLARTYARRIEGTGCTLLDTRKTIPGLRKLSKYATVCGGARNHRMGLYDGVLIKDNHIAVCGGIGAAVRAAKAAGLPNVEAECDTLDQVAEAVAAGADIVLLDNMGPDMLRRAVAVVAGRAKTEASGGVTLDTIRAIAQTGVDFVSVGRITQSAPAADIGLDWS
ncbi:carboxylating nicotinate-nucleotide diphosphorylase [Magnetospirillum sp. UT-4]|uniref:carboxylating nicotinate-nucleotide diphosphorylase n=1 Tax=Magnetospirillum sp. UT-4 TaxID=2681467 RepID=UPI001382AA59|nr:carboxylating nicotinate-nucleotide diphosphorylase [Magnetospirillum sp. UT-4]CAA7622625.1 Nicotinate-nucleotide pyrophosphorylase (carboxylating) [Magnetospirillum sp. UT-4]